MGTGPDFLTISIGHQVGKAYNHFWQECAKRLRPHRITPKQFSMLSLICRNPGISQQEICQRTVSKPPLVAGLLQSLAKRKLVRRQTSTSDRRKRLWWPTPTGMAKEEVMQRKVLDAEQHVCERCGFGNRDRDTLFGLLVKLNDSDGGDFLEAPETEARPSPAKLRSAAGRFATGVTVITVNANRPGEVHGMTANSFLSVSLRPPLVLFSLMRRAKLRSMLSVGKPIGISILAHDQQDISDHFARRKRFKGVLFDDKTHDVPTIMGAHATYRVTLEDIVKAGDHELFLCLVDETKTQESKPLLFHSGSYASIAQEANNA